MSERVATLASEDVAVCEVEHSQQPELHSRYGIRAVPLVVLADRHGVTRAAFAGAVSVDELAERLSELRAQDRTTSSWSCG
jgi:hypothetical protein